MNDLALSDLERRLRRLERQNRLLVGLLCAALAVGTIAASNAQSAITTYEVRAQRFTLLDPNGGVADDWYTNSSPNGPNMTRRLDAGYSGWGYSAP
jgi:hypothetical protein